MTLWKAFSNIYDFVINVYIKFYMKWESVNCFSPNVSILGFTYSEGLSICLRLQLKLWNKNCFIKTGVNGFVMCFSGEQKIYYPIVQIVSCGLILTKQDDYFVSHFQPIQTKHFFFLQFLTILIFWDFTYLKFTGCSSFNTLKGIRFRAPSRLVDLKDYPLGLNNNLKNKALRSWLKTRGSIF